MEESQIKTELVKHMLVYQSVWTWPQVLLSGNDMKVRKGASSEVNNNWNKPTQGRASSPWEQFWRDMHS